MEVAHMARDNWNYSPCREAHANARRSLHGSGPSVESTRRLKRPGGEI